MTRETKIRIAVVGSSGAGKSTFARRLGQALGLPVIELDAINWRPGWKPLYHLDPPAFSRQVEAAIAGEAWVTDGNYRAALGPILARATHLVWLYYSRWRVMGRVVRRSFVRAFDGRELWPGTDNRETWGRWLDKEHPIRWAWDSFAERRVYFGALFADPPSCQLILHRSRRPSEAEALLEAVQSERSGERFLTRKRTKDTKISQKG